MEYLVNFKLTVSDKKGKSVTRELKDSDANPLLGLKIGSETDAAVVGFGGKLTITGGSDKSGVPMRMDIHGGSRKYVLLSKGVGLQDAIKGERVRKLVRANTISEEIYQINCKIDGEIPVQDKPEEQKDSPAKAEKEQKDSPAKAEKEQKDSPAKDEKVEKKA